MPYKACYDCELLFEVDGTSAATTCTECGAGLVDYTPDASELAQLEDEAEEGETLMLTADQVASSMSSGVVATMAIEGLAAKLRAAAEAGASPDALLPKRTVAPPPSTPAPQPTPVRVDPSPRAVIPVTQESNPTVEPTGALATPQPAKAAPAPPPANSGGKGRATKMLDVSELDPNDWGVDAADPGPALPFGNDSQSALPAAEPVPPLRATRPATPVPAQPQPKQKKSKAGLLIAIIVIVGAAGGGGAAWYFTQDKDKGDGPDTQPVSAASEAPKSFEDRLAEQIEGAAVRLPKTGTAQTVSEGQYLIAGMEGLVFSDGQVPGLATARLNDGVIGNQDGREFVVPVRQAFERAKLKADAPFSFALDRKLPARDVLRFAYSAHLSGAQKQAFIGVGTGGYARVAYSLQVGALESVADGVLVVRVGALGFHVTVKDAAGNVISQGEPRIPLREDKGLDMNALTQRLDDLVGAHAGVRTGVVYPSSEMVSEDLVAILARLARGTSGPRFPDVRIALP